MTRPTGALLALQAGFQAGLAAGAPWGSAAYGGRRPGPVPPRLRLVSGVAAGAYAAAAVSLLDASAPARRRRRRRVLRVVRGYAAVGVVANAASRSPLERALWTPWCVATAASAHRALQGDAGA
ncbi:hypothetical protein [Nocardioides nanhaiensis]|uniref:Uncharacterized protein n=1 Tax=Nocardioides nanhaiensis TaxID=1476871 RepID=A0ABP8W7I5_9ACTN